MLRALAADLLDTLLPSGCPGCGARRARPLCGACAGALRGAPGAPPPPGVDWWVSPFAYEGPARELIARAKYRRERAALAWLGRHVAGACPDGVEVDVVTWVPASAARRRENGVDHARLLASAVGRASGRPVRALLARGAGPAQTGRSGPGRRAGPSLRARGAVPPSVLVVDDVATTGASVAAAARALRAAGARRVGVATAARTPLR